MVAVFDAGAGADDGVDFVVAFSVLPNVNKPLELEFEVVVVAAAEKRLPFVDAPGFPLLVPTIDVDVDADAGTTTLDSSESAGIDATLFL